MDHLKIEQEKLDYFRDAYKHRYEEDLVRLAQEPDTLCPEAAQALKEVMIERKIEVLWGGKEEAKANTATNDQTQDTSPWLINLRWQVVILGATLLLPGVRQQHDFWIDWILTYFLNTVVAAAIAGVTLLFFTKAQSGKFWRNQRIAVALLMVTLVWSGSILNQSRF